MQISQLRARVGRKCTLRPAAVFAHSFVFACLPLPPLDRTSDFRTLEAKANARARPSLVARDGRQVGVPRANSPMGAQENEYAM